MSYWQSPELHIGEVIENTKAKFYFQAKENIPLIWNIIPGCGCNEFRFDRNTKRLHVIYSASKIPRYLEAPLELTKHFKIEYKDGTSESITFTGLKVRV